MGVNEDIRILLLKENLTIKRLAEMASKKSGRKITADSISRKLLNETMQYNEAKFLGEILGYDLSFTKRV